MSDNNEKFKFRNLFGNLKIEKITPIAVLLVTILLLFLLLFFKL